MKKNIIEIINNGKKTINPTGSEMIRSILGCIKGLIVNNTKKAPVTIIKNIEIINLNMLFI